MKKEQENHNIDRIAKKIIEKEQEQRVKTEVSKKVESIHDEYKDR